MFAEFGLQRLPSEILFGEGTVRQAGRMAAGLGRRVLMVSDPVLADSAVIDPLLDSLGAAGLEVEIAASAVAELPLEVVREVSAEAIEMAPDVIIGFGGGSSIDLAKFSALACAHRADVTRFYGEQRVPGPVTPLIAIPTTAGTGSEVTPVAVLSDPDRVLKVGVASTFLIPRVAICDPEVTAGCPPHVCAHAGIDALAHAIEAFTARRRTIEDAAARVFAGKNVLSDALALKAIELIGAHLEGAVRGEPAARGPMLHGSLLAGMAFGTAGTAAAHAIQYPVGARTKTPHGLGTGLLLPYVMAANLEVRHEELAACGRALGVADGATPPALAAVAAIEAVRRLGGAIGIPPDLAALGLSAADVGELADLTLGVTRLIDNNPRPLAREELVGLIGDAVAGRIRTEPEVRV